MKKSEDAKTQTDIAQEKEILERATVATMGKSKYGNVEKTYLDLELNKYPEVDATKEVDDGIQVIFKSSRSYIVDVDGNVEQMILPDRTGIEVGDYIKYVPIAKEPYSNHLTSSYTGYSSNQSLGQEYNMWKVLSKNDDGSLELFPVKNLANSRTSIYFSNAVGWNNAVYILHEMSDYLYSNPDKGITAKSMSFSDIENLLIDGTKGDTVATSTGKQKIVKYWETHVAELDSYGAIISKSGITVTYKLENTIHRQPKLFQYISNRLEDKYYTTTSFETTAPSMGYKGINTSTVSYNESGAWNIGYKSTDYINPKIYDVFSWGQYGYLATRGLDTKSHSGVNFGLYHIDYSNYISCGRLFDSAYSKTLYGNLVESIGNFV